jgi:hypothetical protein
MQITFIKLRMVFVLAWTIGDASCLSCQSLYQFHFVWSMSSGILTPPKSDTVIRLWYHWKGGHGASLVILISWLLPSVLLRSGASFLLCTELMWKLGGIWDYDNISKGFCHSRSLPLPSCKKIIDQSCQFAVVPYEWAISTNSSVDSETTFLSGFSPLTAGKSGDFMVGSRYYTCCSWWSLNVCMIVVYQVPSQFLVCFLCSIELGFLFFMLADLSLLCHGSEVR